MPSMEPIAFHQAAASLWVSLYLLHRTNSFHYRHPPWPAARPLGSSLGNSPALAGGEGDGQASAGGEGISHVCPGPAAVPNYPLASASHLWMGTLGLVIIRALHARVSQLWQEVRIRNPRFCAGQEPQCTGTGGVVRQRAGMGVPSFFPQGILLGKMESWEKSQRRPKCPLTWAKLPGAFVAAASSQPVSSPTTLVVTGDGPWL